MNRKFLPWSKTWNREIKMWQSWIRGARSSKKNCEPRSKRMLASHENWLQLIKISEKRWESYYYDVINTYCSNQPYCKNIFFGIPCKLMSTFSCVRISCSQLTRCCIISQCINVHEHIRHCVKWTFWTFVRFAAFSDRPRMAAWGICDVYCVQWLPAYGCMRHLWGLLRSATARVWLHEAFVRFTAFSDCPRMAAWGICEVCCVQRPPAYGCMRHLWGLLRSVIARVWLHEAFVRFAAFSGCMRHLCPLALAGGGAWQEAANLYQSEGEEVPCCAPARKLEVNWKTWHYSSLKGKGWGGECSHVWAI